jgi:hypothetical protein
MFIECASSALRPQAGCNVPFSSTREFLFEQFRAKTQRPAKTQRSRTRSKI